jgi:hypothetical protein
MQDDSALSVIWFFRVHQIRLKNTTKIEFSATCWSGMTQHGSATSALT